MLHWDRGHLVRAGANVGTDAGGTPAVPVEPSNVSHGVSRNAGGPSKTIRTRTDFTLFRSVFRHGNSCSRQGKSKGTVLSGIRARARKMHRPVIRPVRRARAQRIRNA